ncbi:MAG: oxygen-independent coproporphyrinogen III oxidase [Chromatiales bacterium]|nr:oxygen-independent coproporphyrinogen III oxidase [Chromatiales bacterium]
MDKIVFDPELIRRHDRPGPRYTSYPTAVEFSDDFSEADYKRHARETNHDPIPSPLSLYFHIPFCAHVCFYCGCSKIVTRQRERALPYLERLKREIEMQAELFDRDRGVDQLHFGGGTPTFLSIDQLRDLIAHIGRHFSLRSDDSGDYSIEIDPREADGQMIADLRGLGLNRISIGVQDFDPRVQEAVHREQPIELVQAIIDAAREEKYRSVNFDLIYGLPFQTVQTFRETLDRVIELGPDRIAVFNYAHLPERFKPQRRIRAEDLPSPAEKIEILQSTIERLTGAGYRFIGMDHFARPHDELARAQRQNRLHRNFQGYTERPECTLVGMGMTAIGDLGTAYAQNARTLDAYVAAIDQGRLPIERGVALNRDDLVRRRVIMDLICNLRTDLTDVCDCFAIENADYFTAALERLGEFAADDMVRIDGKVVQVLDRGRLLVRNICGAFDRYRGESTPQPNRFSRVI